MSNPNDPIAILFVDDEPAVLRVIARAFAKSPFKTLTAEGGAQALALLAEQRVDVLVSDLDMPGMGGLELLNHVRAKYPDTLRIILTAHATLDRAMQAINEGEVLRLFTKPFDILLFRETIGSLMERIEKLRREGSESAGKARQREFFVWLDESFPGLRAVERDAQGAVVLDENELLAGLADAPPEARELLHKQG